MKRPAQFQFLKMTRNQKGFLAVDYIFSFIIAMGLFFMLYALSLTLSVVEVAQYVAFSSVRAYSAAHKDREFQESLAKNKFSELKKNNVLGKFFSNGYFELTIESIKSGAETGQTYSQEYPDKLNGQQRTPAIGLRLLFVSKILSNQNNSVLGNTSGTPEEGFNAKITGLMIREPSQKECQDQVKGNVRYKAILDLDPRFRILGLARQEKYIALEDNGC